VLEAVPDVVLEAVLDVVLEAVLEAVLDVVLVVLDVGSDGVPSSDREKSEREKDAGTLRRCLFIERMRKTSATSRRSTRTSPIGLASRFSVAGAASNSELMR
jgi:hypothetical protein